MKHFRYIAAAAAAASMAVFPLPVCAAEVQTSVFPYFNENDVNGRVTVVLPGDADADIGMTFDSPEGLAEPYYSVSAVGGSSYGFDIEGRDNTEDDYRIYHISVTLSGGEYGDKAEFTGEFTVPDGNEDPDSFKDLVYTFEIDDEITGNLWDAVTEEDGSVTVTVHLDAYLKGDVDGNGLVDAADASKVLEEYAARSTGQEGVLTPKGVLEADVNGDELVGAEDASAILEYYAAFSTGQEPTW